MKIKEDMKKKLKMKMRPIRVKVRKPMRKRPLMTEKPLMVDEEIGDEAIDVIDDSEEFGLKEGLMESLLRNPTPAQNPAPIDNLMPVIMRNKNRFNEFLDQTTVAPSVPVENIKTVDKPDEEVDNEQADYNIYETGEGDIMYDNIDDFEEFTGDELSPQDFHKMPIFDNFPMLPAVVLPERTSPKNEIPSLLPQEPTPFTNFNNEFEVSFMYSLLVYHSSLLWLW